jgi:hypothetical protein
MINLRHFCRRLIIKPILPILDKRRQDPSLPLHGSPANHRPTSLKAASRTGDLPNFDCA